MMSHNDLTLLGDRVLIRLDEKPTHTTTSSGVILPEFTPTYTDGGRPKDELSTRTHLFKGTVLALSPLASSKLTEEGTPLKEDDKVYISQQAFNSTYQFLLSRDSITLQFEGLIAIPHTLIEAKING